MFFSSFFLFLSDLMLTFLGSLAKPRWSSPSPKRASGRQKLLFFFVFLEGGRCFFCFCGIIALFLTCFGWVLLCFVFCLGLFALFCLPKVVLMCFMPSELCCCFEVTSPKSAIPDGIRCT